MSGSCRFGRGVSHEPQECVFASPGLSIGALGFGSLGWAAFRRHSAQVAGNRLGDPSPPAAIPSATDAAKKTKNADRGMVEPRAAIAPAPSSSKRAKDGSITCSDNGKAVRYPVGVGRPDKQWSGHSAISGKYIRPAWSPPEEIRHDNPRLP